MLSNKDSVSNDGFFRAHVTTVLTCEVLNTVVDTVVQHQVQNVQIVRPTVEPRQSETSALEIMGNDETRDIH